ncbi:MAG: hypothetical protein ACOVO1_03215 [Chitinophagaceae bacterium]
MKTITSNQNLTKVYSFIIASFFLIAKIISWKLWLADRTFPLVPVFDFLLYTPTFFHQILFFVSIVCLSIILIKPEKYWLYLVLIVTETISCILDQNRWQPWEYQYVFMFLVLFVNRKEQDRNSYLFLIILSSIYFYSGLQKVNPHFINNVWLQTIAEDYLHLPKAFLQNQYFIRLGYIIPLFEILCAVGLWVKAVRNISIFGLITTHVFILLLIGPIGLNYNIIVWPWNIAMILLLYTFLDKNISVFDFKNIFKNKCSIAIAFVWIILPALNFVGYWDYYFSSSLYSARIDICSIKIHNPPQNFELKKYYSAKDSTTNQETILVQDWALKELNTPPCPQARVYRKIKQMWLKKYPLVNASFYLYDYSKGRMIKTEL